MPFGDYRPRKQLYLTSSTPTSHKLHVGDSWPELVGMTRAEARNWLLANGYDWVQLSGGLGPDETICAATIWSGMTACCGEIIQPLHPDDVKATVKLISCTTEVALWDFEEHGFDPNTLDTTGTYDSFLMLQAAGTDGCPNGTACPPECPGLLEGEEFRPMEPYWRNVGGAA